MPSRRWCGRRPAAPSGSGPGSGMMPWGNFTAQCAPAPTRQALVQVVRRAKRNKASSTPFHRLAVTGRAPPVCGRAVSAVPSGAGCPPSRSRGPTTPRAPDGRGHRPDLPVDVEPYGPGDSAYAAGRRVLRRAVPALGPGLRITSSWMGSLPPPPFSTRSETWASACGPSQGEPAGAGPGRPGRFGPRPPWPVRSGDRSRCGRGRLHPGPPSDGRRPGPPVPPAPPEGPWWRRLVTTSAPAGQRSEPLPAHQEPLGSREPGVQRRKARYGLEHIRHHHAASLLLCWLVVALGMTIERLYRLRYLHRGPIRRTGDRPGPPVPPQFGAPAPADSS